MIVISTNDNDYSSHSVIDWLRFYNIDVLRVHENDKIIFKSLEFDDNGEIIFEVEINTKPIKINGLTLYWYRRGFMNFLLNNHFDLSYDVSETLNKFPKLGRYLTEELDELTILLHSLISEKNNRNAVGCYSNNFTVKLKNLGIASKVGFRIPQTKVLSTKKDLFSFYNSSQFGLITKAIRNGIAIQDEEIVYEGFTKEISNEIIDSYPSVFFPTLFQEKIPKFIEVRIFYIEKKIYAMAILSQNDTKTQVDFRNYNREKPNYTPPFKLPNDVENRIHKFFRKIDMKSGSIDMLLTHNLEYYFLEVNPIGQYSQVSIPCNYYLDYIIAKTYIDKISHE